MTNSEAWDYAIGMIKVDCLEPTADFKKYIEKEKKRGVGGQFADEKGFPINRKLFEENAEYVRTAAHYA